MAEAKEGKGKISQQQRQRLKHFIKELENFRGRHTELVSVYVPQGYEMSSIINSLKQEQGTASNIKSKVNRDNVIAALEKMIQHLKLVQRTPSHGLVAFAGNVAEREGFQDYRVWSMEPPVPIKIRLYRCDKEFILEPLTEMASDKTTYGLVVMDKRDATVAVLKGKTIIPLLKEDSMVPGKMKAGGQCLMLDTMVQMSDGNIVQISHAYGDVKAMSNYEIIDSALDHRWDVVKDGYLKIITKEPQIEICCSKDHVFYMMTDEGIIKIPAEELKQNDALLMPEHIEISGKIHPIDSKKYYNSVIIKEGGQRLLKDKRARIGLLQKQVALVSGVSQTAISSYEIGKMNIGMEQLKNLCATLSIDFDAFLDEHTQQFTHKDIELPKILDTNLSQFIGYLTGDGSIEEDRITLFEQDGDVARYYKNKYDAFFKTDSSLRLRESKNYYQIRYTSRPLVRFIKGEFPSSKNRLFSLIPESILTSANEVLAGYLKGLFDAEGYVNAKRGIGLGINNKLLAKQVQMSLLRFSIISSVNTYDNRRNPYSHNPRYTVSITEGKSLRLFNEHIRFSSIRKEDILQKLLAVKTKSSRVRQIVIPGKAVRAIIESYSYNLKQFPKVSSFFRGRRNISKEIFKKSIMSYIKDKGLYEVLEKIHSFPIVPARIHKIVEINDKVKMIDISIKDRNFFANGLMVHNSAMRFSQNRELAAKAFYKKIGDMMKDQFLNMGEELKGIIVGGPGPTKYEFVDGNYITNEVKKKILGIKDLSYTDEFGLQELVEKSDDILANEEIAEEKKIMQRFFDTLGKYPAKASYGKDDVMKNLQMGAVDVLLLSESLDDDAIELYSSEAEKVNSTVFIVSIETREGVQLKELGKIAAILRYEVHSE